MAWLVRSCETLHPQPNILTRSDPFPKCLVSSLHSGRSFDDNFRFMHPGFSHSASVAGSLVLALTVLSSTPDISSLWVSSSAPNPSLNRTVCSHAPD